MRVLTVSNYLPLFIQKSLPYSEFCTLIPECHLIVSSVFLVNCSLNLET